MTIALRPWVAALDPYVPGHQAASEDGSLASNESALGASPAVRAAILEASARVHRYPDPLADEVRAALASELGVGADNILVGNGSDELVYLLVIAFAAMGGRAICADPPYRIHPVTVRSGPAQAGPDQHRRTSRTDRRSRSPGLSSAARSRARAAAARPRSCANLCASTCPPHRPQHPPAHWRSARSAISYPGTGRLGYLTAPDCRAAGAVNMRIPGRPRRRPP